jgi:hypothetical protein
MIRKTLHLYVSTKYQGGQWPAVSRAYTVKSSNAVMMTRQTVDKEYISTTVLQNLNKYILMRMTSINIWTSNSQDSVSVKVIRPFIANQKGIIE